MEAGYACFCGNELDYHLHGNAPSLECSHGCFGDQQQPCGGDGHVIVFDSEFSQSGRVGSGLDHNYADANRNVFLKMTTSNCTQSTLNRIGGVKRDKNINAGKYLQHFKSKL